MILTDLSHAACEAMLSANDTAILACVRDGRPYVVPITYAFSTGFLYSFSLEGRKIAWMRGNPSVSLLVVEYGPGETWKSVVVSGSFEELSKEPEVDSAADFAWKALSKRADWWDPGSLKPVGHAQPNPPGYIYYGIGIHEMSGRAALNDPE